MGLIAELAARIEAFRPDHSEEMRGIAAGSGVSFDDIVLINARTEIIAKARKFALQEIIDPADLTMDIAAMPSLGQPFTRYALEGELCPVD